MAKEKWCLSIEEKRQLALAGKPVPVCVRQNSKSEKQRKKEKKRLFKKFQKYLNH